MFEVAAHSSNYKEKRETKLRVPLELHKCLHNKTPSRTIPAVLLWGNLSLLFALYLCASHFVKTNTFALEVRRR